MHTMHELISDLQRLSAFKDHNYDTDEDDDDEEEEEDVHDDGDHLSAGSRLLCVHHKLRRTQLLHLHLCNLDHCSTFPF